ncbi:MAG: Asp-tRNA(Asn)/Glu-tRNA(Gln) amidotransferase subunit GatB [Ignavibacteriaceae bacterium]|jgi:aspartyl-tRNA(Asn)/glutamyl-tRNA(Gln) amidotransferase subunit B
MNQKFEAVIGLEVHAQLLTNTKIFCGCSTKFGNEPNSNVCPICLGHPGVLPVLNKKVVEYAVLMGLATKSTINRNSIFARKNYFYPDLPKGYQISQFEKPICEFGSVEIEKKDGTKKNIGITRIHMEEDAGKSIHDRGTTTSIDVNRCGVPLLEIVSEPDMRTSEEAYLYLSKIKQLVQYLEICDGNMEEGSLRCDANISVRPFGQKELGTKVEIKNMNSFRNVERAINFEINRQIELIEDGGKVIQQTLLWDADANEAYSMRSKEEAHDYRYFPDPDLVPIEINNEWFDELKAEVPELPDAKHERFMNDFHLPVYDAGVLTQTKELANYFEQVANVTNDYKAASNWVMVEVLKVLNEQKIDVKDFSITPQNLGGLINLIQHGTISGKIAKDVFAIMLETKQTAEEIVKEKNLIQISDTSEIEKIIQQIFDANENQVKEFLDGKEKVFGFFVGQTMKATKGKANPQVVNDLLKKKFESLKQ